MKAALNYACSPDGDCIITFILSPGISDYVLHIRSRIYQQLPPRMEITLVPL